MICVICGQIPNDGQEGISYERARERERQIFKEFSCIHGEKYLLIFYKLSVNAGEF